MAYLLSLQSIGVLTAALIGIGYLIRRALIPKPIPGIPYKKASAERLLGDGFPLLKWKAEHGEMFGYVANLAYELNTPIFQMFARPGGKPWVVLADHREAHDIMVRRTKEFDRSKFFGDIWVPVVPQMHAHMPTGDEWRAHRRLLGDTMSPSFLNEVAGPQMWESTQNMIELWKTKARLAQGRPFAVAKDLHKSALDIIWAATFGFETGSARAQTKLLSSFSKLDDLPDVDEAITFPIAADPPAFESIMTLSNGLGIGVKSLMPRIHLHFAFNTYPSLVAARRVKENMIQAELKRAVEKFSKMTDLDLENQKNLGAHMKSAMDIVIARELQMARKEGRAPKLMGRTIQDELFGFLIAGHETTSTTLSWALKYLTTYQDIQSRLRSDLRSYFPRAAETGTSPTVSEITNANIPYFEAVMEETSRCGLISLSTIRQTLSDVYILGHLVPKDTEVLMINNGPGNVLPALPVEEGKRSKTSQAAKGKVGDWDTEGIEKYDPERWLAKDETGKTVFNSNAGPTHSFGAGPRACFGEFMAYTSVIRLLLPVSY
jgi:cytochrome P450